MVLGGFKIVKLNCTSSTKTNEKDTEIPKSSRVGTSSVFFVFLEQVVFYKSRKA